MENKEIRTKYIPKDIQRIVLEMRKETEKQFSELFEELEVYEVVMLMIERVIDEDSTNQFKTIILLTTFPQIDIEFLNMISQNYLNRKTDFYKILIDNQKEG
jgi:hypothetical protein